MLKKIILGVLAPPMFFVLLLVAVTFLLLVTKGQKFRKLLAFTTSALLLAASLPLSANLLLTPLETAYPPFRADKAAATGFIAVLASGVQGERDGSYSLGGTSLVRLQDGVRIHRRLPQRTLVVSGTPAYAAAVKKSLQAWGIPAERVVFEQASYDTATNIKNIKSIAGGEEVVLVTSAFHMPRTMLLAKQQGLRAIPAPCGPFSSLELSCSVEKFIPGAVYLARCGLAIKEYLALAYYYAAHFLLS